MTQHARESLGLARDLEHHDDPLLDAAYVMSEWAITYVGPIFWMCLVHLFLVAEFGT